LRLKVIHRGFIRDYLRPEPVVNYLGRAPAAPSRTMLRSTRIIAVLRTEDVVSFAFRGEAHRTQMAAAVCITFRLRIRIRRRPFAKQLTLCEARAEEHGPASHQ